jgi:hypothetical protein
MPKYTRRYWRLQKQPRNVRIASNVAEITSRCNQFTRYPLLIHSFTLLRSSLFLLLCACALASCADKISSLGAPYYQDTIQFKTVTLDSGLMGFAHVQDTFVTALGQTKNLTLESPVMIVGRVVSGTENVESWGVLKFPIIADTLRSKAIAVRLLLKDVVFRYGDLTNSKVDFQVYEEGAGKVSDSLRSLALTDLSPKPIGTFTGDFGDTANNTLAIPLDSSILSQLGATSFAFVVTPGATMTTARGFGTMENGDANAKPQLEYTIRVTPDSTTTVTVQSNLDLHIVKDASTTPPNEFTVRGSSGQRERITFNLARPTDSLQLSRYSTINSAFLVLHLDNANSGFNADSGGPVAVRVTPTGDTLHAFPIRDSTDRSIVRYQVRSAIEYWLHDPAQNFGLELRAGFAYRSFQTQFIGVEDYVLDRWTFYGQDSPDPSKRPQLILTYSRLP